MTAASLNKEREIQFVHQIFNIYEEVGHCPIEAELDDVAKISRQTLHDLEFTIVHPANYRSTLRALFPVDVEDISIRSNLHRVSLDLEASPAASALIHDPENPHDPLKPEIIPTEASRTTHISDPELSAPPYPPHARDTLCMPWTRVPYDQA